MKHVGVLLLLPTLFWAQATSADWLVEAPDEGTRYERLEQYLGGFSAAMWETHHRYEMLHEALTLDNPELALYHWEKIRDAIRGGYMKRPARQANSDAIFLDVIWPDVHEALRSDDADIRWAAFMRARSACMACHVAEDVEYMNRQRVFTELVAPED
ncbi:MAG: hypothetical protein EA371_01615 [Gammaproteobacteria bacterium]|nr:MAG: hypothetical protein EA371_01615 [Gammaproteobacteria bacterium]